MSHDKNVNESIIEGRNAVMEAFRSGKPVDKLYVLDGCQDGAVRSIIREARKHDTILNFVEKDRLNQLSETGKHQGVIASVAAYEYAEVEDMLKLAEEKGEDPFLINFGNIEDPHKLGAIIRTANQCGAHGVTFRRDVRRTDGNCGKNFRRCAELYAGCKSNESGKDDGRSEEEGPVVCVCRYGRRCHV